MESFKRGSLDVMGIHGSHIRGCGVAECLRESECKVWKEMEGGVVWCTVG